MKKENQLLFKAGEIVISLKGRDAGYPFVVFFAEGGVLRLCDGKIHKTANLKKKNVKHVKRTGIKIPLPPDFENRDGTLDAFIRRQLSDIVTGR